ncbi:MAG: DUF4062 domain-containing protein [Tepidisphaeraceae bacterium]|jgi:hypothetical protein
MGAEIYPSPRHYLGVTVSSTFTDLKEHRAALIKAIKAHGLTDVAMENDFAKLVDVIDSSLQMVRDGSVYIGVISHKYGQVPLCPRRNPEKLSITELEFNEALRLERPILLFVMGHAHLAREEDFESDLLKKEKLKAFRERAKRMTPDSFVHRVYATFDSLDEFKEKISPAIAELRRLLDGKPDSGGPAPDPVPKPPALYAEPSYIGSHKFIGRRAQLDMLSDWALPADPHTVLLFEAIGGNGKSMLTWEWTTKHATKVRTDWAGRFWYSFYEKGAMMTDFCQHALAYVTGQPLEELRKKKTPELAEHLLHHLQARPWLFILDGLERVLVAYHRIDAAEVPDEEVNRPTDKIASRDPCAAIRPEDDDLLRVLATVAPSKLLVSSRLVPRVLLNQASQPIPGVQRISLPGLRPPDAEALLRSCDVTGDSRAIQDYLTTHCDCHPLVIGVLAGLINDYFSDRGNFDAWAADPAGGGQLNLANLDLVQKRNHILEAGLKALPAKSRQLLSTLSLLSEAVDYPTLCAFNPHLPPEPEEVNEPRNPEHSLRWNEMSDADKLQAEQDYQITLRRRKEYEHAINTRLLSPAFLAAPQELAKTVRDLERRGLLQYDGRTKRYDLHPVVRGVAAGRLRPEEREQVGQTVVDHFSRHAHNPYEEAETLEDLRDGITVVRALLKMGHFQQACDAYRGGLATSLLFNLEAYTEVLSLLRPFFPQGWGFVPAVVRQWDQGHLTNDAGQALHGSGHQNEALAACSAALLQRMETANWENATIDLFNITKILGTLNNLAKQECSTRLALELAEQVGDQNNLFRAREDRFQQLAMFGQWTAAEAMWELLDPMGRRWRRAIYRPGDVEYAYAQFKFSKGELKEEHLAQAEEFGKGGKNRIATRLLHSLRGKWRLEQGQWEIAAESLHEAVRLTRAVGKTDAEAETQLALAKFQLRQLPDPQHVAEQFAQARNPSHRALADLWLAIGDPEQAKKHALAAYKWAWADGEPYVRRSELTKTAALLNQLSTEIPELSPYDPKKDEKLTWESEVATAIEKLRAEKVAD